MPLPDPSLRIATLVATIATEARARLADGLDIGDGIWLVATISRLIDAARTLRSMTGIQREQEVMAALALLNQQIPALAKTEWDERIVRILYQLGMSW